MTTKPDGGPAFPQPTTFDGDGTASLRGDHGMSLRDWFAGMALQGVLANVESSASIIRDAHTRDTPPENGFSLMAYYLADAMLKEREK